MKFRALSLLDITKTGVSRNKEVDDQKRVAQFANYMTVENCLQLRSNIKILSVPKGKKIGKKKLLTQKLERKTTEISKKFIKTFLVN